MFNTIKQFLNFTHNNNLSKKNASFGSYLRSYFESPRSPVWMTREYSKFAEEAYCRNVIAFRSINLIAQNAASVEWQIGKNLNDSKFQQIFNHDLERILKQPTPLSSGPSFFEAIINYLMIAGNCFILIIKHNNLPQELHLLRPDRVKIIRNGTNIPIAYQYKVSSEEKYYPVDPLTAKSDIIHLKYFHPLDDFYGLSPIEAAAYSIDQHNQAAQWNQALLQNGARPSGALIVENNDIGLSESQYQRLKEQLDESFSGSLNAGRPMLLEGGLKWQEMSLSNKDIEFLEAKNSAAREIALAFGVPPQLLGIPGDNTYSNLQEARLALWEETIIPLLNYISHSLNNFLTSCYSENIVVRYNQDKISALSSRRETLWQKLEQASYLTINEKRAILGYDEIENGNSIK